MQRRGILILALLVYFGVTAFVLLSGDPRARWVAPGALQAAEETSVPAPGIPPEVAREGLPYRSVGVQIQRIDWMDRYQQVIDKIAAIGADTVLLIIDTRTENGASAKIYLDQRITPSAQQLGDLIDHAKARKLRVMIMPIVLLDEPRGDEWRGKIKPDPENGGWETWWRSYRDMITFFASVAEIHHADVLVVGSELVSTEDNLDEWTRTIRACREVFKGKLTYSSNWDHYHNIPFWKQLDLVGMNSYWKLGDDAKVTVPQIVERWKDIQGELFPFLKKVRKPLVFLEVGWCSMANMAYEPWDYTKPPSEAPLDLDLQKRLYEGFFQAWLNNPKAAGYLGGFSIWEWPPDQSGPEDRGYCPEGKPAADVLRQWLAKPRWEVR